MTGSVKELAERLTAAAEGRRYGVTSDLFNEAAAKLVEMEAALEQIHSRIVRAANNGTGNREPITDPNAFYVWAGNIAARALQSKEQGQ